MSLDKYTDFYELLQVHPKAGTEVIKKAYYTLMQQNHPDKGGSDDMAKKINEAYEILLDEKRRKEFDTERNLRLLEKMKSLTKTNDDKNKVKEKKVKATNIVSKNCPVYSTHGVLVSDERGNRILIINSDGDIVWEYGKFGSLQANKLKNPKFAQFSGQNILITDTGNSKVIEVNNKKETVWQFGTGESAYSNQTLDNPSDCTKLQNGNYLITDTGNKRVIEVNPLGQIVWQYGDLKDTKMFGKSLFSLVGKSTYQLFTPVSSQRLDNGNTLISDIGNQKIIEVSPDRKTVWQYPPKKIEKKDFCGANFVSRTSNSNVMFTLDKVYEINQDGTLIWIYNKNVNDIDINWAYRVDNNQILVNITRIVRRGINQEIMMIDNSGKTLWRYYYSQYKHL